MLDQQAESEEKLVIKDYSRFSVKKLNRILKLRERQIHLLENGGSSNTKKTLGQLKYEREAMTTVLLERAMTDK